MSGVVWLASYPKSGNTWFRMMVANLSAKDEPADINDLPERGGIASDRSDFEFVTQLDSSLLTHEEIDDLRPRVFEDLGREVDEGGEARGSPRLVKVHDAYVATSQGEPMLGGPDAARGAILLVRDPRDVVSSLANHRHATIDDTIEFMADETACLAGGVKSLPLQLRQRLLSWSGHAASWLKQDRLPVHLLRYEDLMADPVGRFLAAMDFAERPVARIDAERAVEFSRFERLQAQEQLQGFSEWRNRGTDRLFFRRGERGAWRTELTAEQIRRVETAHGRMMDRLGYARSNCKSSTTFQTTAKA